MLWLWDRLGTHVNIAWVQWGVCITIRPAYFMAQKSTRWNEHGYNQNHCFHHRYYLSLSLLLSIIIIIIYKMSLANQQLDFKAMFTPKTHLKLTSRASLTYKIKIPFQRRLVFLLVLYKSYWEGTVQSQIQFVRTLRSPHRAVPKSWNRIWQKSLLFSIRRVHREFVFFYFCIAF